MTNKRFERYLLDGGFWFSDDYVPKKWAINDTEDKDSPINFLEFEDDYKDLCDMICDYLNDIIEEKNRLRRCINEIYTIIRTESI